MGRLYLLCDLLSNIVGHFGGNLQRELHEARYIARLEPWGLVDELADAALLDGIGVILAIGNQAVDNLARALRVARNHRLVAHIAIDLYRALVLVEHNAIEVAYGDGASLEGVAPGTTDIVKVHSISC